MITQQELATIFPDGVPIPVMKMIFPEKSEGMTVEDIRYILNAMKTEANELERQPLASKPEEPEKYRNPDIFHDAEGRN